MPPPSPPSTRTRHTNDVFARLCRARDRLREAGENGLSVAEIARGAALSPYQFIRSFKALFGETPHQVRIAARIERAKHLLASSERSVTQICVDVGFSSLGTFSHRFANRVGSAPSLYRRKARAAQGSATAAPGCFCLMWGWPAGSGAILKKPAGGSPCDDRPADIGN